jgi:hypothetical protein
LVSDNEEIISDEGKADFSNTERMSNEADSDVEMTLGEESSGNNVPNNLTMQFNEWGGDTCTKIGVNCTQNTRTFFGNQGHVQQ